VKNMRHTVSLEHVGHALGAQHFPIMSQHFVGFSLGAAEWHAGPSTQGPMRYNQAAIP
jgi:hypothetical protein